MYLKLSVAGHLTIFLTRTRGPFWSIRPARILLIAVFGTQAIATLIAVYGLFMTPLGWGWAGFVWGYALICFLVTDRVKLLAYRVLDHIKMETKMETSTAAKPAPKSDSSKPDAQAGPTPVAKRDPKVEATSGSAKPDKETMPKLDAMADLKPEAKREPAPKAKAGPEFDATAGSTNLLNTTLGDILLAGVLKDPEDSGRLIAAAVAGLKTNVVAAKPPEPAANPEPEAASESVTDSDSTKQQASAPKAAE